MKLLIIIAHILFISLCSFRGCNKEDVKDMAKDNKNNTETFKVKVEKRFCAFTILSVQDSSYYDLGMDWDNLSHVFSVNNHCDLPSNLNVGEVYNCKIIDRPITENCMICMGFMETPPLKYNVLLFK